LVGNDAAGGGEWHRSASQVGQRPRLPPTTLGKAIPYWVYDLAPTPGWVSVGIDHDTAAFAVATLRRSTSRPTGRMLYPNADRLLVTADAGRSNEYRVRA
jgi:hypothetical protein